MAKKPSVPECLRRQVQERAQGRCEYCLIDEADRYYPHEADHVIAEKHGGPTSLENLAWACFYGNRFKGSDLASIDPTHYFTRNRTSGSDFLPFSPLAYEVPTIVTRCFFAHF